MHGNKASDAVRPDRPLSCAVDASLGGIFIGACNPKESMYVNSLLSTYNEKNDNEKNVAGRRILTLQ